MTDKIPESVMKESESAAAEVLACIPFKDTADLQRQVAFAAPRIARRLLARDQRAAEIAKNVGESYGEDEAGWFECSETIERAILSYDEAQP